MIINTHIAGVKFHPGAKEILDELADGSDLFLEPEPDNKFDPDAVRILHKGADDKFTIVGYIPKFLSQKISFLIAQEQIETIKFLLGNRIQIIHKDNLRFPDSEKNPQDENTI